MRSTLTDISLLAAVLIVGQARDASAQERSLSGWGPFRFGMSPEQILTATNIPLQRSNKYMLDKNELFSSKVEVDGIKFLVAFLFTNIVPHRPHEDFASVPKDYRLSEIVLDGIPLGANQPGEFRPCPQSSIYTTLVQKYGSPTGQVTGSMGGHSLEWRFPSRRVVGMGTDTAVGGKYCFVRVDYRDDSIVTPLPSEPKLPRSQF